MCSSSQGCLCQRNDCNLPPTPLHPAHYPVSDRSERQLLYKKAHETFQQDIRKSPAYEEEVFSPCHRYQQIDKNVEFKGWRFFKSLVTVKMKPITTSGYSIPIQTPNESVLMGLEFYLWPCPSTFPSCWASLRPYSQLAETGTSPVWDSHILGLSCHGTLWRRASQVTAGTHRIS